METIDNRKHPDGVSHRTKQNSFFLTEEDSSVFQQFAKNIGFKRGSSQLVTGIVERLIIGGFSPITFLKIGWQLQNFAEKNGHEYQCDLALGIRPLPPLPDDEVLSTKQWKKQKKQLNNELRQLEQKTINP
jgi:hypothetical protein